MRAASATVMGKHALLIFLNSAAALRTALPICAMQQKARAAGVALHLLDETGELRAMCDLMCSLAAPETAADASALSGTAEEEANAVSAEGAHAVAVLLDFDSELLRPPATQLSVMAVRKRTKALLRSSAPLAERQRALAGVADSARLAHRPRAALEVCELGMERLSRWRATKGWLRLEPELLRSTLLTLLALRRRGDYTALLMRSEEEIGMTIAKVPGLLSELMHGCCEAGWETFALAANATLHDAGGTPSTAALNALMSFRLKSRRGSDALDVYVHMRRAAPKPDRETQALATAAAATYKTSWKGLRNLMRRPWLRLPWNPSCANAALTALVRMGNLPSAAAAIEVMRAKRIELTMEPMEALLRHAVIARASVEDAMVVFSAMQKRAHPPAPAYLTLIAILRPKQRTLLLVRALRESKANPTAASTLLAAATVHLASVGRGDAAGCLLTWLRDEGYDLRRMGALESVSAAFSAELSLRPHAPASASGLWALALRACSATSGTDAPAERAATAVAIREAMEEAGEMNLPKGVGVGAAIEYIAAICTSDLDGAVVMLRKLHERALPNAYVLVIEASCAGSTPNMRIAKGVLEMMRASGALQRAAPDELVRIYVALVAGHGRRAELEAAWLAFEDGRRLLRPMQTLPAGAREMAEAEVQEEDETWRSSRRKLYQAMVDAAAPHPRGLLLACRLLEEIEESGSPLTDGYYAQLISGHATASDLQDGLMRLQGRGPRSFGGLSVSDATIAALMQALGTARDAGHDDGARTCGEARGQGDRHGTQRVIADEELRQSSLERLAEQGVRMDGKVMHYLGSGSRMRQRPGSKFDNANDRLADLEGSRHPTKPPRFLASPTPPASWSADASGEGTTAMSAYEREQYEELDRLLEMRQPHTESPADGQHLPKRDTKRAVSGKYLKNLANPPKPN